MLPLDYTIDLTLKGIYGDKEIETTIFLYLSYLRWKSFFSMTWKKDTLRPLIRRADTVCSKDNLLWEELHRREKSFTEFNGYPKWLLKQTLDSFENKNKIIIFIKKTTTI